jgi:putative membrane protein
MFNGMGNGWGMGYGGPFMILFWILVVVGVAVLAKWMLGQSSTGKGTRDKSPLEILRERYARGEIDQEEFEQKRRDLEPPV